MRRAGLIALLVLGILAAPLAAEGQQRGKVSRIGMLWAFSLERPEPRILLEAFRQGLRDLGYTEGHNIVFEHRSAEGRLERFPDLAADLVRLKVDLIVALTTPAARAAKQTTTAIPIVAPTMADPIGDGLVSGLARPGGNVTGLTFLGPELVAKRLELLKEAVPGISRVAALWHPGAYGDRTMKDMLKETEGAARVLGVELHLLEAGGPANFDKAFSAMTRGRADALIVLPSPIFFNERRRIVELAAKHRLPAMYPYREAVDSGGLMAYAVSIPDLLLRSATYVDRILKGAKPADLPVEQPRKFELVINSKTAKALGLTIPSAVLLRADEVIQ